MNWRRVIYIAVAVFVVGLIFKGIDRTVPPMPEKLLNQRYILNEFKDPAHSAYADGDMPDSVYFPYDYTGDPRDEFYLTVRNGEDIATIKYVIGKGTAGELEYSLTERWQDIDLPAERFESYKYENNEWINVNRLDQL